MMQASDRQIVTAPDDEDELASSDVGKVSGIFKYSNDRFPSSQHEGQID